jgi:hypothetical protein
MTARADPTFDRLPERLGIPHRTAPGAARGAMPGEGRFEYRVWPLADAGLSPAHLAAALDDLHLATLPNRSCGEALIRLVSLQARRRRLLAPPGA